MSSGDGLECLLAGLRSVESVAFFASDLRRSLAHLRTIADPPHLPVRRVEQLATPKAVFPIGALRLPLQPSGALVTPQACFDDRRGLIVRPLP